MRLLLRWTIPMYYKLTSVCDTGHSQDLKIDASLGETWVKQYAGLLDGTSRFYVYPPDEKSSIGKCAICGARFKTTVTGPYRKE